MVSLEIGTSHVRVFVGESREDETLQIVGMGDCPSRGMRKGEMFHFDSVVECIEHAIRQAENSANITIHNVSLVLSGSRIQSMMYRGEVPLDGEVTEEDLDRVHEAVTDFTLPPGNEQLHNIMGEYAVDDMPGVSPLGMTGHKLALNTLVVYGVASPMINLARAVKSLKLDVDAMMFSGFCSAMSVLPPAQRLNGALLIDLGAGTTDYMAYAGGGGAEAGVIGVGGDHVTNDICRAFRLRNDEAEALKIQHGDAMVSAAGRTRRLSIPASGTGEVARSVKLSDLQTVIHLRMEETFGLIRERLQRKQWLSMMREGVVLTGGGAHLRNAATLAQKVFGLPCEIGVPRNVPVHLAQPEYATGIGAVQCAYKSACNRAARSGGFFKKLGHWIGW